MGSMSPAAEEQGMPELAEESRRSRFETLRGVRWRIDLGILPRDSSFDDLRRATADRRRRYAGLRRRLLVDPHVSKGGTTSPDLAVDNPLSQNPDSTWGRFFRNAELEKSVDQDLSRLYPEHGSYFQTPGCQGMLRRVLLLWCLSHQEYGYRQGMHELLAPLLYVLHVDLERLSEVRKLYEDLFNDQFDDLSCHENDLTYNFDYKKFLDSLNSETCSQGSSVKFRSLDQLDPEIQAIVLLSDAYGAEGELGIVLSDKFMEHDAYAMFDALMSEAHGSVAMADFFSPVPVTGSNSGLPAVIEASAALYHLLSIVDSSLHNHLVELGVEPQYFALRWLRVLFGREFSLEDLLLIWDELFAADNHKLARSSTDEASTFAIIGTSRGALILGIAVAMILHIRSSLLATENATTCLKRLLNFPENVDLRKLINKARSLQALALEAGSFSSIDFLDEAINYSKPTVMRRHTLSFDSSSPKLPLSLLPDSYWEEKWRVAQKAEENGHPSSGKQSQTRRKGWLEKVGMNHPLPRTESDPSPAKKIGGSNGRKSVRRSLLEDLSRQLGMDEGIEEASCTSRIDQHPTKASEDISNNDVICTHEERRLSESTGSEENSVFSEATSHLSGGNENDNHSEKSSVASNSNDENDNHSEKSSVASNVIDENDCSEATAEDNLPASHLPNNSLPTSESNKEPADKVVTSAKERKPLSSKFQWFWKLGRNAAAEGTLERAAETSESPQSANEAGDQSNPPGSCSAVGSRLSCDNGKDGVDQNVTDTLKNLGHSMLEHIQVIESVFQQDRGQMGSLENFSKNVLVGKGQVTAVAALKELRKISNLLSEM